MPGLWTTPDGQLETRRPGLLLIYEAFGVSDEMGRVVADPADEGRWTVLIPDLFARGRKLHRRNRARRAAHDLDATRRSEASSPT